MFGPCLTGAADDPEGRPSVLQVRSLRLDALADRFDSVAPLRTSSGVAQPSSFFATVDVEERTTVPVLGDGDLWPSCWSDDDALYAANGDGWGMDLATRSWADLRVSRIDGVAPGPLVGTPLARGDQIGSIWSLENHNRKPTGLVCVGGSLYLAIQDLSLDFEAAPALTISRSDDKGRTWSWDRSAPMFGDSAFTTLMFLDFGRDNSGAIGGYVHAYGIDHNWRFSERVPDPTMLHLGRVPADRVQDRAAWEFFTGVDLSGSAIWSRDIRMRQPVLEDRSLAFAKMAEGHPAWPGPMTRVAQGGVFYNAPLKRYIYTSWTRFSWEFYEAPEPWGPWRHFYSKNFGVYPWTESKHGGYAPSASTKYLSPDGKTFYVQANTFLSGVNRYGLALRKVRLEPFTPARPTNARQSTSLASPSSGTTIFSYSNHFGTPDILNDRVLIGQSEDSWNGEAKEQDFWGYTWPRPYNLNRIEYTTGQMSEDGGWFQEGLKVQVRQHGNWIDVQDMCSSPRYLGLNVGDHATYVYTFDDTWGDGIRVFGRPAGKGHYTSIAELDVFYTDIKRPTC
jgi:hypothetical protein